MNLFANAQQRFRELPRTKRLVVVILPLIVVGVIDMKKAYKRGDTVDLIAVAVIFCVIGPLIAIWVGSRQIQLIGAVFKPFVNLKGC
jgi:hypothetical protein